MNRVRLVMIVTLLAGLSAGLLAASGGAADPAWTEIVILASAAQNGELVPCG